MASAVGELLAELSRRGVELVVHGDRLRYRPADAATPELAERLRIHKAELLAALMPPTGQDRAIGGQAVDAPELVPWEDCIEPEPCPNFGGVLCWWKPLGDRRCLNCDPPVKAIKALKRAARIRRPLAYNPTVRRGLVAVAFQHDPATAVTAVEAELTWLYRWECT